MTVDVYVDGSFNEDRNCYGGGYVILVPGCDAPIFGKVVGNDKELCKSRNISGELLATLQAMQVVSNLTGVTNVNIYHDYTGIAYWVTGTWAAKKPVSRNYREKMLPYTQKYNISFQHVRGHSGNTYNEMADKLAREGTFLPLKEL